MSSFSFSPTARALPRCMLVAELVTLGMTAMAACQAAPARHWVTTWQQAMTSSAKIVKDAHGMGIRSNALRY